MSEQDDLLARVDAWQGDPKLTTAITLMRELADEIRRLREPPKPA